MNSEGWSAKSSRVITAFTPGSASALEVSIETMRACGCGLRSTRPMSWPGRLKSAPKRAPGHTVAAVRADGARADIAPPVGPVRAVLGHCLSLSHRRGRVLHRAHDFVVSRAPAEVAGQPVSDLVLRRFGRALQQRLAGHQEPRRADPALQGRVLQEPLLQRMEPLALGHAFDRLDASAADLAAQHEAGAHQPAVQGHAAGAAVARGAAFLTAGE